VNGKYKSRTTKHKAKKVPLKTSGIIVVVTYSTWFTSLTLDTIDIDSTLSEVGRQLKEDTTISPALKSLVSILMVA
jgi:hypothetical protein